jgi:two-component system, sensor histidine kinase and response regulator
MPQQRKAVLAAVVKARADLDRALTNLASLTDDDRKRVSYSAHALNNYLMVVSTTLTLLRTALPPGGDRNIRRYLDALRQATNLMASTARGVLTATPDVLPPLVFASARLSEIAEETCLAYRETARKKKVIIRCVGKVTGDRVITDRVAAGAVLDNLVSNAVKYSEAGTMVSVTTSIQDGEVVCSVRDRGPGLTEADRAKLFQRGVKLSAQPTAGESSTGYGLAIANDLATALGGRLSCASIPGRGSCFTFSLHVDRASVAEPVTQFDKLVA